MSTHTVVRFVGKGLLLGAGLALLALTLVGAGLAEAHGKEVNIAVTCVTPDPGRPLTKACTAFLKYVDDGEPVTKANFQLSAVREGRDGQAVGPVIFRPLDQEGVYSATVTFPAYGQWRIVFQVNEPGEGKAEMVEEILPPLPGASPEIRGQLQIVFAFGLGDLRNVALRVVHLLAAVAWFALSALVLALSYLVPVQERYRLLRRLGAIFPWAAGVALLVIALSGIYSARYNTPTRPPGLFALEVFSRLPFGEAYLAAFFVKMGLALAIFATTAALALYLRKTYGSKTPLVAGAAQALSIPSEERLESNRRMIGWLAAINLFLGLAVFANVVVLAYLHILSHVGGAALGLLYPSAQWLRLS